MQRREEILKHVQQLMEVYEAGLLGGEKMPEHENPGLNKDSKQNYLYFTLPMALNYQRNSYVLWECANKCYREMPQVFDCSSVLSMTENELRDILVEYKVALQPNKQPVIWKTLCDTFEKIFHGDVRDFFSDMDYEVASIKEYIKKNKKLFPYLGGNKICNYWLYVMEQYTDANFRDRENITVAPDTHVIQSSTKLGIITAEEAVRADVQLKLEERWKWLLEGTEWVTIDVHTPMWLWSRGKFTVDITGGTLYV